MGFPGIKGRKPSVDASSEGGAHAVSDLGPGSSEMSAKEQHTHYHYHLGDGKVGGLRSAKRRGGVMRLPFQGGGSRSLSVDMGVGLRDQVSIFFVSGGPLGAVLVLTSSCTV